MCRREVQSIVNAYNETPFRERIQKYQKMSQRLVYREREYDESLQKSN